MNGLNVVIVSRYGNGRFQQYMDQCVEFNCWWVGSPIAHYGLKGCFDGVLGVCSFLVLLKLFHLLVNSNPIFSLYFDDFSA